MNTRPSPMISLLALGWLGLIAASPGQGAIPPPTTSTTLPSASLLRGGTSDLLNLDLRVYVAAKPIYCLLVEKDRQRLRVLRHDGRLQVVAEYPAGTGENDGPKEKEGDAKTPEGVYFITKAYQDSKLSVFGTRAFQLNYPNYCDLGEGRTGFGIYIHGTKQDLRLRASNGCVTLDNGDLDKLAEFIRVGTPVFIVDSLSAAGAGGKAYPDLAGHNFAGAKSLLFPDDAVEADFASLYLIRIHGQTVVVGEYWADPNLSTVRLATAYLRAEEGNRWSVVDRGPLVSNGQATEGQAIPGLMVDWGGGSLTSLGGAALFGSEDFVDRYLTLWREASAQAPPRAEDSPAESATSQGIALGAGTVYGLLLGTTVLSVLSGLVLSRRRWRRGAGSPALAGERGGDLPGERDEGPVIRLQEDVHLAYEALQGLRGQIEEEARSVASLAAVQARITALEGDLQEKQQAIERFEGEQASLISQGLAARSDQAQTLSGLQGELAEVRQSLDEARQTLRSVAEREGMMQEQLTEIRRLAESNLPSEDGAVRQELTALCESLRDQVETMAKAMSAGDQARQESGELAIAVAQMEELLQKYALEGKGDTCPVGESRPEGLDPAVIDSLLQGLRADLREEQAAKQELLLRLGRMIRLEEELAVGQGEVAVLRQQAEAQGQQAETDRQAMTATIEGLQGELRGSREAQAGLEGRLLKMRELEAALATRQGEIAALRQEVERQGQQAEAQGQQAETDRQAMTATIEGLQAEVQRLRVWEERAQIAEGQRQGLDAERNVLQDRLRDEQLAREALEGQLGEMRELAETLAGRERELEGLRNDMQAQHLAEVAAKTQWEEALAVVRGELEEERRSSAALTSRLGRISELEAELVERGRELSSLRIEAEQRAAEAVADKSRLAGELAEIVLARQIEVTNLTGGLHEAKEKSLTDQEEISRLTAQVEIGNQSLRGRDEQLQAQHETMVALREEVVELQTLLEASKKKVVPTGAAAVSKGTSPSRENGLPYLPNDVLSKWIGRG